MTNINLKQFKKVYFVGIGGIGISAIARMMHLEGKEVIGSDMAENEMTRELAALGIPVTIGQGFDLIPKDADLIVYTIAIPHYDPKLFEQIKNSGVSMKSYPEMLGIVTANKYTIAVAGTHGKTTTTAMIAKILVDAGLDPSVIVGSLLKGYKSNLIVGKSEYFVVEACEYERSFLNVHPKLVVIINIEADHLDYYKDLADIKGAFQEFENQSENVINDYSKYLDKVPKLMVPGEHNRQDAAAALAVADFLKIDLGVAQKSLETFAGTWRRLEKKGETAEGVTIYDDYAHHPTEIRASLQALRELYPRGQKNIVVLFQPHLYSRTRALFKEFSQAFTGADRVYLLPIYFARETQDDTISSEILAEAIDLNGVTAYAFPDFESAAEVIKALNLGKNDVFVTMGAGEAYKVADQVFDFE
ncbi:MAG: UDP-N-acetylmuramate--L-alanine ligase [Candidatus Pacebacteria bacterium]|nr:UDP-N-acetylmuramate--L-alanine ligase [Candidatus Paceibacterota bacterium]